MPSQNYDDYLGDSSCWAKEGYGIPEFQQFLRKTKADQDAERARMAGSTTEVHNDKTDDSDSK